MKYWINNVIQTLNLQRHLLYIYKLDVKDYAFCDAIKEAKAAIEKMNAEVESIQQTADRKEASLTDEKENQEKIL